AAFGDVDDGEASAWRLRQSLISSLRSVHSRRQFDATPGIYSGAETMRRFDPGRQVDDLALVGLDGAVRRRLVMLVEHRQFPVVGDGYPKRIFVDVSHLFVSEHRVEHYAFPSRLPLLLTRNLFGNADDFCPLCP